MLDLLENDFGTTVGFKKRLLKWENQIVDLQKANGEVFSDRLKCAIAVQVARADQDALDGSQSVRRFDWR